MNWSLEYMSNIFRMILGLPKAKTEKTTDKYEILPEMHGLDVVKINERSFRDSDIVQAQVKAARDSMSKVIKNS